MTIFQSIVLGLVQGIGEFLPISSSGHLKVAQELFRLDGVPLLFDVFLHLATLLAVVIYFRRVIVRLFAVLFRWIFRKEEPSCQELSGTVDQKIATLSPNDRAGRNTILMVLVTTVVTGVLGVASSKIIPDLPIRFVCIGFLVTAILLILSAVFERKFRRVDENGAIVFSGISLFQALVIGFMQGVGTLPGVSRSGSTIAGALFCKVDRITAGDYSFIVSIPAILGAFVLELKDIGSVSASIGVVPVLCGCAVAFVSGFASLSLLMKLINKGKLEFFALYLIPVSILLMILF
ncbi:MAG: undecaprenyl-diphosphate phosphatase [Treponema sp.]|nr:undecaprenyl-diphosphate phosphatase [Treponema sp.]